MDQRRLGEEEQIWRKRIFPWLSRGWSACAYEEGGHNAAWCKPTLAAAWPSTLGCLCCSIFSWLVWLHLATLCHYAALNACSGCGLLEWHHLISSGWTCEQLGSEGFETCFDCFNPTFSCSCRVSFPMCSSGTTEWTGCAKMARLKAGCCLLDYGDPAVFECM